MRHTRSFVSGCKFSSLWKYPQWFSMFRFVEVYRKYSWTWPFQQLFESHRNIRRTDPWTFYRKPNSHVLWLRKIRTQVKTLFDSRGPIWLPHLFGPSSLPFLSMDLLSRTRIHLLSVYFLPLLSLQQLSEFAFLKFNPCPKSVHGL